MENILVSACLLGLDCKYDGGNNYNKNIEKLKNKYNLIPVCPEIFGGLSTPRHPSERLKEKIITKTGNDVTIQYKKGAEETLKLAKLYNVKLAVLKERSPSCGKGKIYDGTFSHNIIDGNGVTAELLLKNGIKIYGESEMEILL